MQCQQKVLSTRLILFLFDEWLAHRHNLQKIVLFFSSFVMHMDRNVTAIQPVACQ